MTAYARREPDRVLIHQKRTARFWVWGPSGFVKLSLRPGQSLTHEGGGPCEEGYDVHGDTWTHAGDHLVRTWWRDARDCDGRITDEGMSFATRIEDVETADGVEYLPRANWQEGERRYRDHQAEAAGY